MSCPRKRKQWKSYSNTFIVIGCGKSLMNHNFDLLAGLSKEKLFHSIAVNRAFRLGNWLDAVWTGDSYFVETCEQDLQHFAGIKAACMKLKNKYGFYFIKKDEWKSRGISANRKVSWNMHSGGSAINFAYLLGARRIFLLGFDYNRGKSPTTKRKAQKEKGVKYNPKYPANNHLRNFPSIAHDAKRLGISIYNVIGTPLSNLSVFDCITYETAVDSIIEQKQPQNIVKKSELIQDISVYNYESGHVNCDLLL